MAEPLCRDCATAGIVREATVPDHIVPLTHGGSDEDSKSTLKQVDRERSLIHLMRVNMLKRMESSIHSFALTVEKIHAQVGNFLAKIDAHEATEIEELLIEDIAADSPELEDLMIGRKVKVLIQDLDLIRMRQDLEADHILLGCPSSEHLAQLAA